MKPHIWRIVYAFWQPVLLIFLSLGCGVWEYRQLSLSATISIFSILIVLLMLWEVWCFIRVIKYGNSYLTAPASILFVWQIFVLGDWFAIPTLLCFAVSCAFKFIQKWYLKHCGQYNRWLHFSIGLETLMLIRLITLLIRQKLGV